MGYNGQRWLGFYQGSKRVWKAANYVRKKIRKTLKIIASDSDSRRLDIKKVKPPAEKNLIFVVI